MGGGLKGSWSSVLCCSAVVAKYVENDDVVRVMVVLNDSRVCLS